MYKRQPEYRVVDLGDRVAVDLLGAVFSGALEGEAALPVDSDVFSSVRYNQHGDDLGSVSYTHLDVYKRQSYWPPSPITWASTR